MDPEKLKRAYRGLPPRKPRGDPANQIRALMFPYLIAGLSPEEAIKEAVDQAKALLEGLLLLEKEAEVVIEITAPEGAPGGEEEAVADELVNLAETIAEVTGAPKPKVRRVKHE